MVLSFVLRDVQAAVYGHLAGSNSVRMVLYLITKKKKTKTKTKQKTKNKIEIRTHYLNSQISE